MNAFKSVTIGVLGRILPNRIKNSLFHLSFNLARLEFEKFAHDYAFAPNMTFGLMELSQRGFVPKTVVDVGAFQGAWSKLARRTWPTAHIIMIEPNMTNRLALVAGELNAPVCSELLGAVNGQRVQFNVMGAGSSIMNERSPLPRTREMRTLRTLDSLNLQIERPAFLKIDAQGYELEILKGATCVISALEAILLEIAILEINEGAPLLHDVLPFMKGLGFVAYDILEIHRRPLDKALNQIDVVFAREDSALLSDRRHFSEGAEIEAAPLRSVIPRR